MSRADVDIVVAGAGVAGTAAAAALAGLGFSVLLAEPGQHADRRLAGELIHPPGIDGLKALGLYNAKDLAPGARLHGFAVLHETRVPASDRLLLYDAGQAPRNAIALEQGRLRRSLTEAVQRFKQMDFQPGTRVARLNLENPARPRVALVNDAGEHWISCRLVVAADGVASPVRNLAGIRHDKRRVATLTGYLAGQGNLPHPGFGHLFIGGTSPVLAYPIDGGRARVLFDQAFAKAGQCGPGRDHSEALATLPPALHAELDEVIATQRCLSAASYMVRTNSVTKARVVLVGDAAGTCHPLTASGMTSGILDALCLRDAMRDAQGNLDSALALYARRRRASQAVRRFMATYLHDIWTGATPERCRLRAALRRYWDMSEQNRTASMALLAMADTRQQSLLREVLKMTWCCMHNAPGPGLEMPGLGRRARLSLALDVTRFLWDHAKQASALP